MDQRIALFQPSLRGGGAERVSLNLASGFVDRGHAVDVVLAERVGSLLDAVPADVRVVDLKSRRVLTSLSGLAKYLRRERPKSMIAGNWHTALVALWARRLARVNTRVVVVANNTFSARIPNPEIPLTRLLPPLLRVFIRWADAIVACSREVAEDLAVALNIPEDSIEVIYNPVVTSQMLEESKEAADHPWFHDEAAPVILGAGRLTWEKDFATLIRAFERVRRERPARLLIVGEGADRSELEELVRELDLEDDVQLPGFVENPYPLFAQSAVFVLSSVSEGLANVLIEALAIGTPTVSTSCKSGPREILDGGRLGRLVPPQDAPALASAILATLEDPGTPASAEDLQPYGLDSAVDSYLHLMGMNGSD